MRAVSGATRGPPTEPKRVSARSAADLGGDGPTLDRRREYVVRFEGGERSGAESSALGSRWRRTPRRLRELYRCTPLASQVRGVCANSGSRINSPQIDQVAGPRSCEVQTEIARR